MPPRANLLLLPLLLAAGARTASAQGPVSDAFYLGEGNVVPGGFDQSVAMTIAASAQQCDTFCFAGNGLTPAPAGTLVGFTYEPGATTECICLENSVAGTNQAIEGVTELPGSGVHQYCYYCGSERPSGRPSSRPSGRPSSVPSEQPSGAPSENPSGQPSGAPSENPSGQPSSIPSEQPSGSPSENPSGRPSSNPSEQPSGVPSEHPSGQPSSTPSEHPSGAPSEHPSLQPSSLPSERPSGAPSERPSLQPSSLPSERPSGAPSESPSRLPSSLPSEHPSGAPSDHPSRAPSSSPSFAPSANPSRGCENARTDCGWGIFNPWTCRCDCPVGICLDDNEQCYLPCADTIHTNPWAGCVPGWDCPWFPDESEGRCRSEMHQANNFEIYRTAGECCDEHYGGAAACVADSKASAAPRWPIHFPGSPSFGGFAPPEAEHIWGVEAGQPSRWFPDLQNKRNCVFGGNYESWMNEDGFAAEYLFGNDEDCCEKWFPARGSSCPDAEAAVNPEAEDEAWFPTGVQNYYFPDFSVGSCGFGRDYPAWMGINGFEKFYLFRQGSECCGRHFPTAGNCPFESTPQTGAYWEAYQDRDAAPIIYNHTYYPDIQSKTCVNGTDYPSWMAEDDEFKRLYLFGNLEGCCNKWMGADINSCVSRVIQGRYILSNHTFYPDINAGTCVNGTDYPSWMAKDDEFEDLYLSNSLEGCCNYFFAAAKLNSCVSSVIQGLYGVETIANITDHRLSMWYPDLDGYRCKNDRAVPAWMLQEDYEELYLFNTQKQCCAAFGYC